MFFINSPLSQFEVTNLIGIFAPIFGQFNIILTNLALYTFLIIIIVIGLHYFGNNDSKRSKSTRLNSSHDELSRMPSSA